MTRQALLDLAARCEAATGADRELDDAIASEIFTGKHRVCVAGLSDEAGGLWMFTYHDGSIVSALRFTASLDAAMTLVPKGDLHLEIKCGKIWAFVGMPIRAATAATPALALTAASLRALAQEIEHD